MELRAPTKIFHAHLRTALTATDLSALGGKTAGVVTVNNAVVRTQAINPVLFINAASHLT
jgi:hypothetical protein